MSYDPLPPYQVTTYIDLADVWRIDAPEGGRTTDPVWVLAEENVPCRFVPKSSVDVLSPIIGVLGESDDLITVDQIRFPGGLTIESSWAVVNRSLEEDGSEGPYFNKIWILRGEPKRRRNFPGMPKTARVVAFVSKWTANAIPDEITEHYS